MRSASLHTNGYTYIYSFVRDTPGDKDLTLGEAADSGKFSRTLLTSGLETLYEGKIIIIATKTSILTQPSLLLACFGLDH